MNHSTNAPKHQRINPRLYRFIKKGDLNRLSQVIKGKA